MMDLLSDFARADCTLRVYSEETFTQIGKTDSATQDGWISMNLECAQHCEQRRRVL